MSTEQPPDQGQTAVDDAKRELVALRKQLDSAIKALEAACTGHIFASAAMRRRNGGMKQVAAQLRGLLSSESLDKAETELENIAADAKAGYRTSLERALSSTGWDVAREWPSYLIERVVELKIDFRTERAKVGQKTLPTLEIDPIVAAARGELDKILRQPFDPKNFLTMLVTCYRDQVGAERTAEYVGVTKFVSCMKKTLGQGYGSARLGLDLSRLLDALPDAAARLDFSPARNPDGALYLRSRSRSGFVSGIRVHRGDEAT